MIFVTVGTHEQSFNRLIECVDSLKRDGLITEEVIMQTGYSTYEPKYCKWQKLYPYQQMQKIVADARIVITHGGPSSFIMPLQIGKTPIVVPRRHEFNEHVNDHQFAFSKAVAERMGTIIVVEEMERLAETIQNYDKIIIGENYTTLTHGYDVAFAISSLIGNKETLRNSYNLVQSVPIKWDEFFSIYCDVLKQFTGNKVKVKIMSESILAGNVSRRKFQVLYDRVYSRKFDNEKIISVCPKMKYAIEPEEGIREALKQFLEKDGKFDNIDWQYEGFVDKMCKEYTRITTIPGMNNKVRYLVARYTSYFEKW